MALSRLSNVQYGAIVRCSVNKPWECDLLPKKSVRESLCVHLTDPKTSNELLILGTSNISTVLGYRNFELASKFNPTSVLLQTSPSFGDHLFGNFQSSEEFQDSLNQTGYSWEVQKPSHEGSGFRVGVFETRKFLMLLWLNTVMRTPSGMWRFFVPGIDSKLIHDFASHNKREIVYAGEDFNAQTMEALRIETRMDVIFPYLKYYFGLNNSWEVEAKNAQVLFRSHSIKSLAEGHFNQDNVAWFVKFAEKLIPHQKKIVIDKRDEDIFWNIEKKMKGNKKLVLVNQWHMDGIQRLWRSYHGVENVRKPMMNTSDLPLEEIQGWMRGIDHDREVVEKRTGYPMALEGRENTSYWDNNRSHYA